MKWLERLSRNLGLMVHNMKHPDAEPTTQRKEVSRTVEEEQIDSTTTLRRTTIEEVEIKNAPPRNSQK